MLNQNEVREILSSPSVVPVRVTGGDHVPHKGRVGYVVGVMAGSDDCAVRFFFERSVHRVSPEHLEAMTTCQPASFHAPDGLGDASLIAILNNMKPLIENLPHLAAALSSPQPSTSDAVNRRSAADVELMELRSAPSLADQLHELFMAVPLGMKIVVYQDHDNGEVGE